MPFIQRNGSLASLSTATTSATIYYRTNGLSNWMVYGGSFYALSNSVGAWACRTKIFNSDVTQE